MQCEKKLYNFFTTGRDMNSSMKGKNPLKDVNDAIENITHVH